MGRSKISSFTRLEDAKKDFEKKFREKTKNKWAERDRFVAHSSKYTLIEVQGAAKGQESVVPVRSLRVGAPGLREGPAVEETQQIRLCHCPAM